MRRQRSPRRAHGEEWAASLPRYRREAGQPPTGGWGGLSCGWAPAHRPLDPFPSCSWPAEPATLSAVGDRSPLRRGPQHRPHRRGRTPSASRVGGSARAWSSAPPSARPPPRWRTPGGRRTARSARSEARTTGSGTWSSGRRRPTARSAVAHDLVVGERLRAGQLEARRRGAVAASAPPPRSRPRPPPRSAGSAPRRSRRSAAPAGRRSARAASARGRRACRRSTARRPSCSSADASHRLLGQRLGAEEARARVARRRRAPRRTRSARAPARSAARTRRSVATAFSSSIEPPRLVADRRRQVDHRVHAAQRVAERGRVGEVAERDLHAHALVAQAARVAHQAAHGLAGAPSAGAAAPSRRARWRR